MAAKSPFHSLHMFFSVLIFTVVSAGMADTVDVACVGNSITWGNGDIAYPDFLEWILNAEMNDGNVYRVHNLGESGRTVLIDNDHAYLKSETFPELFQVEPEIVTIMLGTNDSKGHIFSSREEFEADLTTLIDTIEGIASVQEVYLVLPPKAFKDFHSISDARMVRWVNPGIRAVALKKEIPLIDCRTVLEKHPEYLSGDGVHPVTAGEALFARLIFEGMNGTTIVKHLIAKDASVDANNPSASGNDAELSVGGGFVTLTQLPIVEPDRSVAIGSKLKVTTSQDEHVLYFSSSDDTWEQGNVTFETMPQLGDTLGTQPLPAADTWMTFNVTGAAKEQTDGALTLLIAYPDSSTTPAAGFAASESGDSSYVLNIVKPEDKTYPVTVTSTTGGSVTPSAVQTKGLGDSISITATADPGYHFVHWRTPDNAAWIQDSLSDSTVASVVYGTTTIEAFFKQPETITLKVFSYLYNSRRGTVSPRGTNQVTENVPFTISATPDSGFVFKDWRVEKGLAFVEDPLSETTTITCINGDARVVAYFTPAETDTTSIYMAHDMPQEHSFSATATPRSLTITTPEAGAVSVSLFDARGGLVFSREVTSSGASHFTMPLPSQLIGTGMYFCRLQAGDQLADIPLFVR